MNLNNIFAEATCEVWKERIAEGSCTPYEAECALKQATFVGEKAK